MKWTTLYSKRNTSSEDFDMVSFFKSERGLLETRREVSRIYASLFSRKVTEPEVCEIIQERSNDDKLKKAMALTSSSSKTIIEFLENEEQYGELF